MILCLNFLFSACAAGYEGGTWLAGSGCTACVAGTFKATAGDGPCYNCAAGQGSTFGATACTDCLKMSTVPMQGIRVLHVMQSVRLQTVLLGSQHVVRKLSHVRCSNTKVFPTALNMLCLHAVSVFSVCCWT